MINEKIEIKITKENVIFQANKLCKKTRKIIESLYSSVECNCVYDCSKIRKIIEKNKVKKANRQKCERYELLANIAGATGVYIFLDTNKIPIYIGKGGIGKQDDLATRVRNECKIYPVEDSGATLSKNIKLEKKLLGITLSYEETVQIINGLRVISIKVGKMIHAKNQRYASYLESLLIMLFNPRLNRQN